MPPVKFKSVPRKERTVVGKRGKINVLGKSLSFMCKECGEVEDESLRWRHSKCEPNLQSEEIISASMAEVVDNKKQKETVILKKAGNDDSDMQGEPSVPKKRMDPQDTDDARKPSIIKDKLNKLLLGKSSSVPSATDICAKMTHIREAVVRKETMGGTLQFLNLSKPHSTYSKEVAPEPPVEVASVLYASFNSNLMKVYWKPPAKDHLIDGYKVLTSEDGEVWSLAKFVGRRKHSAFGLTPAMTVGVCSYKGDQDSEIVVSSSVGKKRLMAESSELYKTSSFIAVRRLHSSVFFNTGKYPYIDVPRCRVKMVPMLYHKVLCTPVKLTPLSVGLRLKTEGEDRISKSVSSTDISSSIQRVKYCFCLEKELVSLILNSKDPSFDNYGIQVLVRFCLYDQSYIHEDEVPDCIVRVNSEIALLQIQDKHYGPLDITKWCNLTEGKDSEDFLSVEWMPSRKKSHCVTICVAEKLSIPGIVSNLMMQNVKDCFTTKEMVQNKFEYDKYVSCTGLKATLTCPLGKTRIVSPCRGSNCTHIQCMDALTLLKMNEGRPLSKKKCFMCDEPVGDIYIDGLFLEILSSVPDSVNEIEFRQNGSWSYEKDSNSDNTVNIPETMCHIEKLDPQCDIDMIETKQKATTPFKEFKKEEEILGAMKSHLSRLRSQVDQLEYLSKQHELFKEKIVGGIATGEGEDSTLVDLIDNEDQGLVDLTSDSDEKLIKLTVGKVKKIEKDCGVVNDEGVVKLLDDNVPSVVDLTGENDQGMLTPTDSIENDCVGNLNKAKINIKQSGRKKDTEKKIENLIANMLKCVKKSEGNSVREKDIESHDDKSEGVKRTECAESDIPFITFEDTDDDDIVEIDLVTGKLENEEIDSAEHGIIEAYKEDGTLASDAEISLSGNVHHHAKNWVLPGSDKHNENQGNDDSGAIREKQNTQVKTDSMSNDLDKDLNVQSKKTVIYLDVNSDIHCKRVYKRKKGSPEKDKETTRNLKSVQHSKAESKRNEKADCQGGTGKKVGYDECRETAKTKRKIIRISSDSGNHHPRTIKKCKILKLDGTLAESDIRLTQNLLSPVIEQKDHEIDLKLTDSTINHIHRDNVIHLEKEDTEICDEQININCDNLETDQGISPIRTEIGPSPEQKHLHFKRLPTKFGFNCPRTRSSQKDLEINPSQTDCQKSCREQDRKISTERSDDVSVFSHKRIARKGRNKLIVDEKTELPEEYFSYQILFNTDLLKKKMDLAPPTKEQMRRVESGIEKKLKKSLSGPDLEDVLRSPCILLRSKRLQRFYDRNVCSSHEHSAEYFDHPKDAFNPKSEVKRRSLRSKEWPESRKKLSTNTGKILGRRSHTFKAGYKSETNAGQTSLSRTESAETVVKSELDSEELYLSRKDKEKSCLSIEDTAKADGNSKKSREKTHLRKKDIAVTVGNSRKDKGKPCWSRKDSQEKVVEKAVHAVKEKALTAMQASKKYGVTSTTIKDKLTRKIVSHSQGNKQVPGLGLGGDVEDDLTKVIKHLTEHGFISRANMVHSFAKEIIDRCGHTEGADRLNLIAQVLRNFFKSQPEISKLLDDDTISSESGTGFEDYTARWFASLNRILSKYGIKNKPERIYSCDRFELKPCGLVKNSESSVGQDNVASNSAYAHLCICSDGRFLPPKVTFQKTLPSTSDNSPTFLEWFKTVFLPNCGQERPVCLLMVNRTCDLTIPLVETAIENEVVLIGLPLLAINVLQPLEAQIIEPLNSHIQDRCCSLGLDSTIQDNRFHVVLQYGIKQIASSVVKESFQATGICPLGQAAKRVDKSLISICPEQCHNEEPNKISSTEGAAETIVKLEVDPEDIIGTFPKCGKDTEQFAQCTHGITPAVSVKVENQELYLNSNDTTLSVTDSNRQTTGQNEVVPMPPIIDIRNIVPASTQTESDIEQSGLCDNDITLTDIKVELDAEQADLSWNAIEETDVADTGMDCHYRKELMDTNEKGLGRRNISDAVLHPVSTAKQMYAGKNYNVHRGQVLIVSIKKIRGKQREFTVDLQDNEEAVLLNLIMYMFEHGFPVSIAKAGTFAREIIHRFGCKTVNNQMVARHWIEKFNKRHPELAQLQPQVMPAKQMPNEECITKWFTDLERILTKYDLKDRRERIYNFEKFDWQCTDVTKSQGTKGNTDHRQKTAVVRHVTASLCVNADGGFVPTIVIFQGLLPDMKDLGELPPSMCYATSEYGHMNSKIFLEWFKTSFLPNCGQARPVCLIMNNQTNLLTLEVVETAVENDVVLIGFPAHAAFILQPLDAKIIRNLKACVSKRCRSVYKDRTVTSARFPALLRYAIDQVTTSDVKEAFKATAICPFRKSAVDMVKLKLTDCQQHLVTCKRSETAQGNPQPPKSSKQERQKLGLTVPAPVEKITGAAVRVTACKLEDFVVNSGGKVQKSTKRKFSDVNKDPVVCLKRKKELDVQGHTIYV